MKKKILSMALACALVLSTGQTAGAADTNITTPQDGVYKSEVEVSTEVTIPTINITLSDTSSKKVGINPYKLKFSVNDSTELTDTIANLEETITNESNVAIAVNVTTKAEVPQGSKAVVATAPLKGTEITKSVFSYLQIKEKDSAAAALTTAPAAYDAKSNELIAFAAKETTKKAMVTLAAGDTTATYAGYKIFGDVASKPAEAWTTDDTLKFSIVFQFEPVVADSAAGN
ncbi:MAG: hypothetical protein HFH14_04895 [Lachnospiraceae bacterium]|nr:hypothetical protein [Lachnospiraceae bacterium]